MALPIKVVKEDRQLSNASDSLAALRWHWTLNEENPERVSFREYGRAVGRDMAAILRHAKGYALYLEGKGKRSIDDCIAAAATSPQRKLVADEVGARLGVTPRSVVADHNPTLRDVEALADERAKRHGTTFEQEVEPAADYVMKRRVKEQKRKEKLRAEHSQEFMRASDALARLEQAMKRAVPVITSYDWQEADERKILKDRIGKMAMLMASLQLEVTGETGVDWDTELARFQGGVK